MSPVLNLFDRLQDFGSQAAVVADDGECVSYRELAQRADACVAGVRPDCRLLALDCDNSLPALCAYLGAWRARLPAILLDPRMDGAARERLLALYGVDAWWSAAQRGWLQLQADEQAQPHPDLALLLSTSGSTGSPKLVRLSWRNLDANAAAIANYLDLTARERPITTLPMHYSYGLSVVNSHLAVGATLLLSARPLVARGFWDFFREQGASSLAGVPAMYSMLSRLGLESMDLPSLRTLTQAGGRLAPDAVVRLALLSAGRGWRFFVMYGQTEAGPRMSYLPPALAIAKPGSIGRPIPGGRMRLVDPAGNTVSEPGVEGELLYEGPNVMMGYAQGRADLALGDLNCGQLRTGDLAWFDADRCFHITGRIQRFLKMSGKRLNLDEVEAYAADLGLCSAATGHDDLLLLAVKQPDRPPAQIFNAICERFGLHHSSVRVVGVAEFPMSGSGKVRYAALLANMLAEHR